MMNLALQFCELALNGADALPAAQRADCYDYAARLLAAEARGNPPADAERLMEASGTARRASDALREAEAAQLTLRALLKA